MMNKITVVDVIRTLYILLYVAHDVVGSESKENYYSIGAHLSADGFSRILRRTANDLLLVPDIQNKIDSMSFVSVDLSADDLLDGLMTSMNSSLSKYADAVRNISQSLSDLTREQEKDNYRFYKELVECSRVAEQTPRFENYAKTTNFSCCTIPTKNRTPFFYPHRDIIKVLSSSTRLAGVRGSFVVGSGGVQLECPSKHIPIHRKEHWREFVGTVSPIRKNVVVLLDAASLVSEVQLMRLKTTAKILLEAAASEDRYSIVASTSAGILSSCDSNVRRVKDFIDHLRLSSPIKNSSHSDLFKEAFTVLRKENLGHFHNIIQYISRGVLSELGEAARVMETIAMESVESNGPVKINTFAITDENRTPMLWTTEFLRNVAKQNFSAYKGTIGSLLAARLNESDFETIEGEFVVMNGSEHNLLRLLRVSALLRFPTSIERRTRPLWTISDESDNIKLSISLPSYFGDGSVSYVSGMEMDLEMVADAVKTHRLIQLAPRKSDLAVYLTDAYGKVLVGPPASVGSFLYHVDSWPSASRWVLRDLHRNDSDRGEFNILRDGRRSNYLWRKIPDAPLVLIVRSTAGTLPTKIRTLQNDDRQSESMDHLLYHRMDLQRDPSYSFCSHFGGLSVDKKGSLYLSPHTLEPTARQLQPSSQLAVNYWVFLSDRIGLIRSSAIRLGVREEAGALAALSVLWTDTPNESPGVIRRYMATRRGLMVTVPAAVVIDGLDPTQEIWFTKAMRSPGRVVFSGPYADPQLGDVITLSTVVYQGAKGSMHTNEDEMFGVVAVDITGTFFRQLIEKSIPACFEGRKCVVVSSNGDVLAGSTSDFSAVVVDAVERFHVGHVEPLLATHLLSESNLVRKWQCVEREGRVRRREYSINTTFTRVHTVRCGGEGDQRTMPIQSEVLLVPGTDIFLALVNSSCAHKKDIGAFCPCSVSDRRCLFCARFDPLECECPCQCSSPFENNCHGTQSHSDELPLCEPLRPPRSSVVVPPKLNLPLCYRNDCSQLRSRAQCSLTVGCEWCSVDGLLNPLPSAFCSATSTCYQGVKGRNVIRHPSLSSVSPSSLSPTTPVGLIAGVVVFMFIGLVIAVYSCYRSKISRIGLETRGSSDSFGVPLFSKGNANGEFTFDHEGIGSNADKILVLASFERAAPSRQGAGGPGTESDLGYSTMTERNHSTINGDTESETGGATSVFREPLKSGYLRDDTASSIVTIEADVHRPPNLILLAN